MLAASVVMGGDGGGWNGEGAISGIRKLLMAHAKVLNGRRAKHGGRGLLRAMESVKILRMELVGVGRGGLRRVERSLTE
jgi:hypothetical protein